VETDKSKKNQAMLRRKALEDVYHSGLSVSEIPV